MRYPSVTRAVFIDRPNRFVARVERDGAVEIVHVKNTGRMRELLLPGARVWLTPGTNPERKTKYDLIAVELPDGDTVNIDSQAPNAAALEWLSAQAYDRIVPEYRYGGSRIDFYAEKAGERFLMEVKGCTLKIGGVGYFPDAPTDRGVKHLRELMRAKAEGYRAAAAFVIQMNGVAEVRANRSTHPEFADALEEARAAGVAILMLPCRVSPDGITIV